MQEISANKEKLMALANVIVNCCSHDEISMLCIALLDANLKCKLYQPKGE